MRRALTEPPLVRGTLLAVAVVFLAIFLVMPLVAVFAQALEKGLGAYLTALREPDAWAAIRLTLLTAAIAVVMLVASFLLLGAINRLQSWASRRGAAA